MDWRDRQKLNRLAEIKAQMQPLETEAKEIQEDLVKRYGIELPVKWNAAGGTLTRTVRQNYKQDGANPSIIAAVGQEVFNQKATMSITTIRETGGQMLFDKLVTTGAITIGFPTIYYSFKA